MTTDVFRRKVSLLLFGSGFCALIYQIAWLREFRLVFGASTAASAAVLGIFMGGLGLGSALLCRRVEASRKPLRFYSNLELLIGISAALTPGLLWAIREIYVFTGGATVLGQFPSNLVRLLLASLVLVVPTFLMGGTLPAAARAVQSEKDLGRRQLAGLYGLNTLGAVCGAAAATFYLIEHFGNRGTLWAACLLNLLVAMAARKIASRMPDMECRPASVAATQTGVGSRWFVMIASAGVGFAFMLMELVWYRMLGPILGGSTFTFGLILVLALLGVGAGGAMYAVLSADRHPTLSGFALTCALEAFFIAVPFALGDWIAHFALLLRPLVGLGFAGQLIIWGLTTSIVVIPAAFIAGYQFPMLIALLGQGNEEVGQHTGQAYAANTVGSLLGSLVGGFGLLPILTAPVTWRAVVVLLALLALLGLIASRRRKEGAPWFPAGVIGLALILLLGNGPTATWRHGGIGAGRVELAPNAGFNQIKEFSEFYRRTLRWEAEGVESSVGLIAENGLAFVVNGKVDGNSRGDSGTQVMAAMTGAILHPAPKRALVIGLGTGSSAGWLGAITEMERVDVVELEPAILEVARQCAPINHDVLNNPKVQIQIGDAREVLPTTPRTYDLIFSEPSNPYRAGVASLFTTEFYEAVKRRLAPGGIFMQWVQAYEIDGDTLRNVYATLGSVFPSVETWQPQIGDFLLIATREQLVVDSERLRQKLTLEPYSSALDRTWGVDSLEGFLSHYVANDKLTRDAIAAGEIPSTDDRNTLEFSFVRSLGRRNNPRLDVLRKAAVERQYHRPAIKGDVNWDSVDAQTATMNGVTAGRAVYPTKISPGESAIQAQHRTLITFGLSKNYEQAAKYLAAEHFEPLNIYELSVVADINATLGREEALPWIAKIRQRHPSEADALQARLHIKRKEWPQAAALLQQVFVSWRTDPWARLNVMDDALNDALSVASSSKQKELALLLFEALEKPFSVMIWNERRLNTRLMLSKFIGPQPLNDYARIALDDFGPHLPWNQYFLKLRWSVFRELKDPRLEEARRQLQEYLSHEPSQFTDGLPQAPQSPEAGKTPADMEPASHW